MQPSRYLCVVKYTIKLLSCFLIGTLFSACGGDDLGVKNSDDKNSSVNIRQQNIFAAVDHWYVNSHWATQVKTSGGEALSGHSTAVWLNRIADIEPIFQGEIPGIPHYERKDQRPRDEIGLRAHLQSASEQDNALLQLVVYNLPGRDCTETLSYGELPASEYGLEVYKTEFIDRIVGMLSEYPELPVVIYLEPKSLPYLVVGRWYESCQEVNNQNAWGYTKAVRYAINTFSKLNNVYIYLDIGSSALFGWDFELTMTSLYMHGVLGGFDDIAELAQQTADDIENSDGSLGLFEGDVSDLYSEPPVIEGEAAIDPPGYDKIAGFVSNVADYVPLDEPHLGDPILPEGVNPLRSAIFFDWNPRMEERTYGRDWLTALEDWGGEIDNLGIVIDTSRNGWGLARTANERKGITQNPAAVNEYRIDQREHRLNWCNQPGGLGVRPQAGNSESPWIDAYAWVKPPGESDGSSEWELADRPHFITNSRRAHEPMCDPDQLSVAGQSAASTADLHLGTGAMPNAPHYSIWFPDNFHTLMKNAWPKVCNGQGDDC